MFGADLLSGDEDFVSVGGGHPDVDDGGVGLGCADRSQQRGGVGYLGIDIDPGVGEQPGDALAGEHHVIGDDYPHGISARQRAGPVARVPPSADPVAWQNAANADQRQVRWQFTTEDARTHLRDLLSQALAATLCQYAKMQVRDLVVVVRGGLEPFAYLLQSSHDAWLDVRGQHDGGRNSSPVRQSQAGAR